VGVHQMLIKVLEDGREQLMLSIWKFAQKILSASVCLYTKFAR
jgi:hypothetical protein